MKKLTALFICLIMCVGVFAGCGDNEAKSDGKLDVIVTIFPQYDFVKQIAGDRVNLTMLLPLGSETHSFEPSSKDIVNIQKCDLFVYTGAYGDEWIINLIDEMRDKDENEMFSLMDTVDIVEEELVEGMEEEHEHGEEEEEAHEHEEELEYDEHVWTSPENAAEIAKALTDRLCELDPDNADYYKANRDAYTEKLDTLDGQFESLFESAPVKTLLFGDRFPFRYFADEYDLEYYAAFPGCSTEVSPAASTIMFLIDKVKELSLPVVFYMESSDASVAKTIADEAGVGTAMLHSCHTVTKAQFDAGVSYLDLMTDNLETLTTYYSTVG